MWQKIKCFFGWHGKIVEKSYYWDYYHNRFVGTCVECKHVLYDYTKYGDWG